MQYLLRVLYVEDDSNDRTMFGIMAERVEGVEIWLYTLATGHEAIDYIEGNGQYADRVLFQLPEVIVTDCRLPTLTGFDLLEWRKASGRMQSLPIILFCAPLRPADLERAKDLGANAILEKPLGLEGWTEAIREIYTIGMEQRRKGRGA